MKREVKSTMLLIVFAIATSLSLAPRAVASLKDDFQKAANEDGCKAIPYDYEQTKCEKLSEKQGQICKDYGCDKDTVQKTLQNYKEAKQNLSDARSRNNETGARDLEQKMKDLDAKLIVYRNSAAENVHGCFDCLEARERVQRMFSDMSERIKRETAPEIQQYIPVLLAKFETGRKAHIQPMQIVTEAANNCKWVSQISW